jgi:hypothetical protein
MEDYDEDEEEVGEEEEDSEDGDESDYKYAGETRDNEEKINPWLEKESSNSDEKSGTENQSPALLGHQGSGVDPYGDVVLELCYSMAIEDFKDRTASSSLLVYFNAVRGLSRPKGNDYLRPYQFTPVLSRLIYCTRLIFLKMTLLRFPHLYAAIPARPSYGHLRRLMPVRIEKICDGTISPLGEFLSLLSYGCTLSQSEGPVYHFY